MSRLAQPRNDDAREDALAPTHGRRRLEPSVSVWLPEPSRRVRRAVSLVTTAYLALIVIGALIVVASGLE
jgi:hypothetical protein